MSKESFKSAIQMAYSKQVELQKIQKETVKLVNELKNRSRRYMEQVADIDHGFSNDPKNNEAIILENVTKLNENIKAFNQNIGDRSNSFAHLLQEMLEFVDTAIEDYEQEEGQLTDLLKCRRSLLYLDVLLRKFKSKISSLQLMNNALFAFSQDMKGVKEAYKSNLINVNTLMTQALEDCCERVERIETIN